MGKVMMMMALMVAGALTVSVEMAQAQGSGFYVAPKAGYSWADTSPSSVFEFDSAGIGVAVGYDLYQTRNIPVRFDLEYFYRFEKESHFGNETLEFSWQTVMANAYYDFRNSSKLTPFVNAGLGFAYISTDITNSNTGSEGSHSETNFAWSVGTGMSYAITDNIAMDLSYRYIGVSGVADEDGDDGVDFDSNEVLVGARFSF